MRLIDADVLARKIEENISNPLYRDIVCIYIELCPTIAAEPVKHGRWDITGRCSNCGKYCGVRKPDYSYCPNCGAKMSSEVEEETLEMWNLDGSPTRYIKGAKMDEVVE